MWGARHTNAPVMLVGVPRFMQILAALAALDILVGPGAVPHFMHILLLQL